MGKKKNKNLLKINILTRIISNILLIIDVPFNSSE